MRKALKFGGTVLAWTVIIAAVAALTAGVLVPRIGGATPYAVLTGSMLPGLEPGTLVVVKPVVPERIRVGEVVTFQLRSGDPAVVTHRVVAKRFTLRGEQLLRTKGDANDVADAEWVMPVQIKGRVWYALPYLGRVGNTIRGDHKRWLACLLAAGCFGYAGFGFAASVRERRRQPREVRS